MQPSQLLSRCAGVLLLADLAGCTPAAPVTRSGPLPVELRREQATGSRVSANALELLRGSRVTILDAHGPRPVLMLRERGPLAVALDGVLVMEGAALLRELPPHHVTRIQVMSGAESVQRFGPRASYGAVLITTRRH